MGQINSGSVRYLRRKNTGDYNHVEAAAEFSFTVDVGEDHNVAAALALTAAHVHVRNALDGKIAEPAPTVKLVSDKEKLASAKAAPKKPPATVEDPTAVEEPAAGVSTVTVAPGSASIVTDAAEVDDIMTPSVAEINDVELTRLITEKAAATRNATAIKALIGRYVGPPPGNARGMTQEQRRAFVAELAVIKEAK